MHDLARRDQAVRATMARWQGETFAWGSADCAKVAAWHVRAMGHHLAFGFHKAGGYRTALGAKRALTRAGHSSLSDALENVGLERIAPAMCLPGDLLTSGGTEALEAIGIVIGNGAFLGFHEDAPTFELQRMAAPGLVQGWRL